MGQPPTSWLSSHHNSCHKCCRHNPHSVAKQSQHREVLQWEGGRERIHSLGPQWSFSHFHASHDGQPPVWGSLLLPKPSSVQNQPVKTERTHQPRGPPSRTHGHACCESFIYYFWSLGVPRLHMQSSPHLVQSAGFLTACLCQKNLLRQQNIKAQGTSGHCEVWEVPFVLTVKI